MTTTTPSTPVCHWRRPARIANPLLRWTLIAGAAGYLLFAMASIEINWSRAADGLPRAWRFISAMLHPDFVSRRSDIAAGLLESIAITVVASIAGVLISFPVAVGATRNMAGRPVYLACRTLIAASRALPELIIAIFFVAAVGFGPLAGVLTLCVATIGFFAKLLAEEIEACDPAAIEAIRSTGAGWLQTIAYAVLPQVKPRIVGLWLYRVDINFREAAIIGVVGAGGIGATLNTSFDRYEFETTAAILLLIIGIVVAVEHLSGIIRRRML